MNVQDIRTLYAHNVWANRRILAAARGAQAEAFATAALGYVQLRKTLVHTLSAEWIWRSRWQGNAPTAMLDATAFATLDSVIERWDAEDAELRVFLAALTDEDLQRRFTYRTTDGTPREDLLWQTMIHLVTHGMQHRSELALLLTELGHSPGEIDFIGFAREQH